MKDELHYKLQDGAAWLTIDRPERKNALSRSLLRALANSLDDAGSAGGKIAIITGAGGMFSAGADLSEIVGTPEDADYDRIMEEVGSAIRKFPGPVVALVNGPCIGAAVDLALSCDIRFCTEDAWFEVPAVRIGLLYNPRAVYRAHRRVPPQTLARLFLLAERIAGSDAREAGIVADMVDPEKLAATARTIASRVSQVPSRALSATKELLVALDQGDVDMASWEKLYAQLLGGSERHEALEDAKARLGGSK